MLQKTISQPNNFEVPTQVTWQGATSGNYNALPGGSSQSIVTTFSPSGAGVQAFNHIPHLIEFYGRIHLMYATSNTDEEEPGQYVRYQYSDDYGATWSTAVTLLESQDDITKGWTSAGRVCIPSSWAVANGEIYAVVDINDKGGSNSSRTGVGVLAVRITESGTISTPKWIENVNGTTTAPTAVSGYPSYNFDASLRALIRGYLTIPCYNPTWYFSVPSSDFLYSRESFEGDDMSEPSAMPVSGGYYLKLWRRLVGGANRKVGAFSQDGVNYEPFFTSGVPDWPSRTTLLALDDRYIIVGNNDSTDRSPLFFAQSEDGLVYKAENIYNIDTETTGPVYSGQYKDTGVQYPALIKMSNGRIMVAYSVNKEDMDISTFLAPDLV